MPEDLERDRRLKAAHGIAYQGLAAFAKYQADVPVAPIVTYRQRAETLNTWVRRQGMLFVEQISELDVYDRVDQDPAQAHQFITDMGLLAMSDLKWSLSPTMFATLVATVCNDSSIKLINEAYEASCRDEQDPGLALPEEEYPEDPEI